jgi:hypothetical protein
MVIKYFVAILLYLLGEGENISLPKFGCCELSVVGQCICLIDGC